LPVTVKVKQRSTVVVAGAGEKLSLTIDDITRGQTIVSLLEEGRVVDGPRSMQQGDSGTFTFGGQAFALKLTELENNLVGDDFASFAISAAGSQTLSEKEKIERLIAAVEALEGATFIRNKQEHSAKEAADHLRLKLKTAGEQITTADQFIEQLATESSTTGEAYEIRFSDGRKVTAAEFFRDELKRLDAER
jgi:hypothetical protein